MWLKTEENVTASWSKDPTHPLVSIVCITYNHENYIRETLNSFLLQKTDFPFEILIHDDASTDGNSAIIRDFQKKFPNISKIIIQDHNQYSKGVRVTAEVYKQCRGKYIAYCEGDDYWTCSEKLQKQYDFLESNPDFAVVTHDYLDYHQNSNEYKTPHRTPLFKEDAEGFVFSSSWQIDVPNKRPLTGFFRVDAYNKIDYSPYKYPRDYHFYYHILKMGKGYWMNQCMGVYRIHDHGIASGSNQIISIRDIYRVYKEVAFVNRDDLAATKKFVDFSISIFIMKIFRRIDIPVSYFELFSSYVRLLPYSLFMTPALFYERLKKRIKWL